MTPPGLKTTYPTTTPNKNESQEKLKRFDGDVGGVAPGDEGGIVSEIVTSLSS
jgi:hypothetical protein